MSASLVGSEMCIRDSPLRMHRAGSQGTRSRGRPKAQTRAGPEEAALHGGCLLYTSDAADDM
eukprot:13277464-Alexandrium_andersonii.AAC.1